MIHWHIFYFLFLASNNKERTGSGNSLESNNIQEAKALGKDVGKENLAWMRFSHRRDSKIPQSFHF